MKKVRYGWIMPVAFAADRVTKLWADSALRGGRTIEWWPGVLRFVYVENTGAAFGVLKGNTLLLSIGTGIALIALFLWLLLRGRDKPGFLRASLWLLLGGALGNFADRLFLGVVIDFIEIRLFRFPVFNIADCCICAAFVLLAGWIFFAKDTPVEKG